MSEQQPKSDSVKVIEVVPAEANEESPSTDNQANPLGLLGHQFTVAAEAAWTSDQRQEIQKNLIRNAQAMRERLDTFLHQLRADRRASEVMKQAEALADTVRDSVSADDVRKNYSHMADLLGGKVREAGERFSRHGDEPKKN